MADDPESKQALLDATRTLYRVFGRTRGENFWVDGLDDVTEEYAARPARLSVKELTLDDVNYFFSHGACGYDPRGIVRVVKYFLPRVLEEWALEERLAGVFAGLAFDEWFIGKQLKRAGWLGWANDESCAVQTWLDAWVHVIVKYNHEPAADIRAEWDLPAHRRFGSWLELAAEADLDSSGIVAAISLANDAVVARLVDACLSCCAKTLSRKGVLWESSDPANQQPLKEWLLSYGTEQRLETAFFANRDPGKQTEMSASLQSLQAYKASLLEY